MNALSKFWAYRVKNNRSTFADVPAQLKQVSAGYLLGTLSQPELVPAEYGGTAQ